MKSTAFSTRARCEAKSDPPAIMTGTLEAISEDAKKMTCTSTALRTSITTIPDFHLSPYNFVAEWNNLIARASCGHELVSREQARDTTATLSAFGVTTRTRETCRGFGKTWGLIAMTDDRNWLLYLVPLERLDESCRAARILRAQGVDVETIARALTRTEPPVPIATDPTEKKKQLERNLKQLKAGGETP